MNAAARRVAGLGVWALSSWACADDSVELSPPTINSFTADGAATLLLDAGERVTLAWDVAGATQIRLEAEPGGVIEPSADPSGQIETAPVEADTRFILIARGLGGEATKSVRVSLRGEDRARIERFTVTPRTVNPGESATLSWKVVGAREVRVDEQRGTVVAELSPRLEGTVNVTPPVTTTYVLWAFGVGSVVSATVELEVAGSPEIEAFAASPSMIAAGQTSLLSWSARNVDLVALFDESDPSAPLLSSAESSGTFPVRPSSTRSYRLVVSRRGFPDVDARLSVTVHPQVGAGIISFFATPDVIPFGRSSALHWEVSNAPDGVVVRDGTGTLVGSSTQARGSFTVTPTRTIDYELVAKNQTEGDANATLTLLVRAEVPMVDAFAATPSLVPLGTPSVLSWQVLGAQRIDLYDEATGLIRSELPSTGTVAVTMSSTRTVFRLEAGNVYGDTRATVVVSATPLPIIDLFTISPVSFVGGPVTVTVQWAARNLDWLELTADGSPLLSLPSAGASSGSFGYGTSSTTRFVLLASNASGTIQEVLIAADLAPEIEPNESGGEAQNLSGDGGGVLASASSSQDTDVFTFVVPDGGSVRARTSDGADGCSLDTRLELLDSDAMTVLVDDEDDGPALCSEVEPSRDGAASDLRGGVYFLRVRADGPGAYALTVDVRAAACGNGLLESRAGETCDDGNLEPLDGCDVSCQTE